MTSSETSSIHDVMEFKHHTYDTIVTFPSTPQEHIWFIKTVRFEARKRTPPEQRFLKKNPLVA